MKNNILFVIISFRQGGISRALQNMLAKFDTNRFNVDVFAIEHYGPYENDFPNCNILPESKVLSALYGNFDDKLGGGKILSLIIKLISKVCDFIGFDFSGSLLRYWMFKLSCKKQYSAVIAFSEGLPTRMVSFSAIENKISWIHCDYENYLQLNKGVHEYDIYNKYKTVVCVSNFTKSTFERAVPSFKGNVQAIYNVLDTEMMKKSALECEVDSRFKTDKFTIISVGRIDQVKNLSIIPEIAHKLKNLGADFRWYILGPKATNDEFQKFQNNLSKYENDGVVYYLGSQYNPYKYISKSDLLVNTSLSEACPYVINEARVLGIPLMCNSFASAIEFIDTKYGFITSLDEMPNKLMQLTNNTQLHSQLRNALSDFSYDNLSIIRQIELLIEN